MRTKVLKVGFTLLIVLLSSGIVLDRCGPSGSSGVLA